MSETHRNFLERPGHRRFQLQRLIAEGNHSNAQLAKMFGASATGIRDFATRHAQVIAEMRADLGDKFAGLWIADKRQRVAAYERNAELIAKEIEAISDGRVKVGAESADGEDAEDGAETVDDISGALGRLTRAYDRALRQVAEELGQLPTRMVVKSEGGGAVHVYGADVDTTQV